MKLPSFILDESGQRVARYETRTLDLTRLRGHLPAMRTTAEELSHIAAHRHPMQGGFFMMQAWHALDLLCDLHAAAIAGLEQERGFSAMALAKEAIRLAVDTTYVFCDPEGDRMQACIRRQVDGQRERAAQWKRAFPDDTQPGPLLARLDDVCRRSPWYAQAPGWPSLVSRAEAVGLHSWVHPIFSTALDASEAATQHFMDSVECELGPKAEVPAAQGYLAARRTSDALHAEVVALLLSAHVLHLLALNGDDPVAVTVAESGKQRMEGILVQLDRLADAHVDDGNVYFGVRFRPA
jgi:hypothetical protein